MSQSGRHPEPPRRDAYRRGGYNTPVRPREEEFGNSHAGRKPDKVNLATDTLHAIRSINVTLERVEERLATLAVRLDRPLTTEMVKARLDTAKMEWLFDHFCGRVQQTCDTLVDRLSTQNTLLKQDKPSSQVPNGTSVRVALDNTGNNTLPSIRIEPVRPRTLVHEISMPQLVPMDNTLVESEEDEVDVEH